MLLVTAVAAAVFAVGGFFVFVIFVGAGAVEFGRGTFQTMLLRQPRRLPLLIGKTAGLLAFAASVLLRLLRRWMTPPTATRRGVASPGKR